MMAGSQQLPLEHLIHHVTQDSYDQLTKLVELLPNKDSTTRKQLLLKYLHETRCRFLRLLVVVKSLGVAEHATKCSEILRHFENKDNIFANVGHRLRMHHVNLVLHGARVPAYAIPNAVDMLTTGTYTRIPTKIKALAPSDTPGDGEVRGAMRWLDQHIGSRLIDMHLPHVISTSVVRRGRLWLTETGLYEVSLTLSGPQPDDPWRLLSLDVLVGQTDSDVIPIGGGADSDTGRDKDTDTGRDKDTDTGRDAGSRALARDHIPPLHQRAQHMLSTVVPTHAVDAMCTTLRGFCLAVRLTMLIEEATRLERSTHRSRLRVRHTGGQCVTLEYWLAAGTGQRQAGTRTGSDGSRAMLKVELSKDFETDAQSLNYGGVSGVALIGTHYPPLIDPATGNMAVFDPARMGVAGLIQRAVNLNVHQRLAALVTVLQKSGVYPTGVNAMTLVFCHGVTSSGASCDAGNAVSETTACLRITYRHCGAAGASGNTDGVDLYIHVDPTAGIFYLRSTSAIVQTSEASMAMLSTCADQLNTDVADGPSVIRRLRMHMALCVLEAAARSWPVSTFRQLPATAPRLNPTNADTGETTRVSVFLRFHRYPRFVLAVGVLPTDAFAEHYELLETDGGCGARYATPASVQATRTESAIAAAATVGAPATTTQQSTGVNSDSLFPKVIARMDVASLRAGTETNARTTKKRRTTQNGVANANDSLPEANDVANVSLPGAMAVCLARIPAVIVIKHLHKHGIPYTYSLREKCATLFSLPPPPPREEVKEASAFAITHAAALCSLVDTCVIRTATGDGQAEVTFQKSFPVEYVRVMDVGTNDIAAWDSATRTLTFRACDVDVCVDRFVQAWHRACWLFAVLVDVELDGNDDVGEEEVDEVGSHPAPTGFFLSGCRCFFGFTSITVTWDAEACEKGGGSHTGNLVCNNLLTQTQSATVNKNPSEELFSWVFPPGSPMQLMAPQFTWELNAGHLISDVIRLMRYACAALTGVQMLFDQERQSSKKTCVFIPRDCTQARLVYKGVVGVDLFFASPEYVLMQQTNTATNVGKLEDFINGMVTKVEPSAVAGSAHVNRDMCDRFVVPSDIFVAMCTSACAFPISPPTGSATATAAFVPLGRTTSVLPVPPRKRLDPPLKQFLNSMHMRTLLEAAPKTLDASGMDIQRKSVVLPAVSSMRPQAAGAPLVFVVNGGQRRITVTSHSLTHTSLSLVIDSSEKDFLDMTEKNTLKTFFHTRVAAENVFVSGVVESFMNIVASPLGVLRQFVKLMASDLAIGDKTPHAGNIRLHLTVPPGLPAEMQCMPPPKAAVLVEKTTGVPYAVKAYMIVRLRNAQQQLVDLALCFNGKDCGWGWGQYGSRRTPDLDRLRHLAMHLPQSLAESGVPSLNMYPNDVFGDAILALAREHHGAALASGGDGHAAPNTAPAAAAASQQLPATSGACAGAGAGTATQSNQWIAPSVHGQTNGTATATNGGHVSSTTGDTALPPGIPILPGMAAAGVPLLPLMSPSGAPFAVPMAAKVQDNAPVAKSVADTTPTSAHIIATSNTAVAGVSQTNSSGPLQDAVTTKPGSLDAAVTPMDTTLV